MEGMYGIQSIFRNPLPSKGSIVVDGYAIRQSNFPMLHGIRRICLNGLAVYVEGILCSSNSGIDDRSSRLLAV